MPVSIYFEANEIASIELIGFIYQSIEYAMSFPLL